VVGKRPVLASTFAVALANLDARDDWTWYCGHVSKAAAAPVAMLATSSALLALGIVQAGAGHHCG